MITWSTFKFERQDSQIRDIQTTVVSLIKYKTTAKCDDVPEQTWLNGIGRKIFGFVLAGPMTTFWHTHLYFFLLCFVCFVPVHEYVFNLRTSHPFLCKPLKEQLGGGSVWNSQDTVLMNISTLKRAYINVFGLADVRTPGRVKGLLMCITSGLTAFKGF